MKTVLAILFLMATLALVGCQRDEGESPPTPTPHVYSVEIAMGTTADTLSFLPGDRARLCGIVLVLDEHAQFVPGVRVNLYLEEQNLGFIVYDKPELRDTTDERGRVGFCFISLGHGGRETIVAECAQVVERHTLALVETSAGQSNSHISIVPSRIFAGDSALVTFCPGDTWGGDTSGVGIPGIAQYPRFMAGRLVPAPAAFDSAGCTRMFWYCDGCPSGRYCSYFGSDSACVTVTDTVGGH